MEFETYNRKGLPMHHKHHWGKNFLMFLAFVIVILAILIGATPLGQNLTGFSVSKNTNLNNTTPIITSLSIPELTLKNEFEEIRVTLDKNSTLIIGGQKFFLSDAEKEIVLKKFLGTITFDENKIYVLKGKASQITLGGIKIEKDSIDFNLESENAYKSLSIPNEFYIKSLNYIATGQIKTDQDTINVNLEKISLNEYRGNLTVQNKQLILNGKMFSLEISGPQRKIFISK